MDRALRILQDLGHSDERHGSGSLFLSTCGDPHCLSHQRRPYFDGRVLDDQEFNYLLELHRQHHLRLLLARFSHREDLPLQPRTRILRPRIWSFGDGEPSFYQPAAGSISRVQHRAQGTERLVNPFLTSMFEGTQPPKQGFSNQNSRVIWLLGRWWFQRYSEWWFHIFFISIPIYLGK